MISIPGSLSFAKLVMMSSAPAKSTGDARYASQDPFIQSTLSHAISTPNVIRSAFFYVGHIYLKIDQELKSDFPQSQTF